MEEWNGGILEGWKEARRQGRASFSTNVKKDAKSICAF
jgi:hypothetical protein